VTTLGRIIESARHALSGFDTNRDAVSALSGELDSSATAILIDDAGGVGQGTVAARGLAEIDFEIVRVKSVDAANGSLLLYPFGRGYRGTDPVAHSTGAEIRFNPGWPASTVAEHVNGVLREIYPRVYAVKSSETTFPADAGAITVPATAVGVISVWVADSQRTGQWLREDRWTYQPDSTTTGKGLRVGGHYSSGRGVRVVYAARPVLFDLTGALSQDFVTVTGLDERLVDLIEIGVAARMAPFIDVGKLPFLSASARTADETRGPGQSLSATKLLYSLFQQRVEQEQAVLAKEHPIKIHHGG